MFDDERIVVVECRTIKRWLLFIYFYYNKVLSQRHHVTAISNEITQTFECANAYYL